MVLRPKETIWEDVPDPIEATSVAELMRGLKVGKWDVLMVTDGSGHTGDSPGGFCSLLVIRQTGKVLMYHGSASSCNSQEAEVRAVFEGINGLVKLKLHKHVRGLRVHILTDSQQTCTQINKTDPLSTAAIKSHPLLWAGFRQARRLGISITGHHLPRNSNPLMCLMDEIAGLNRKLMNKQVSSAKYREAFEAAVQEFPLRKK